MYMSIYWFFSCRKKHLSCITQVILRIVPQVNAAENLVFSPAQCQRIPTHIFKAQAAPTPGNCPVILLQTCIKDRLKSDSISPLPATEEDRTDPK